MSDSDADSSNESEKTLARLKRLRADIDEVITLRENLAATQQRCTELLLENRELKRVIAEAADSVDKATLAIADISMKVDALVERNRARR